MAARADDQSFDGYADAYDRFCDATHTPVVPWLEAQGVAVGPGGRAVDLGCGSGRHCVEFADRFDEVVGVDLSEPLLAIAAARRARPNVSYVVGDLATFEDRRGFDFVFSSTALHHVSSLPDALRNIRALVRPGGWVALRDGVRVADARVVWLWRHGGIHLSPWLDFVGRLRTHGVRREELRTAWQVARFEASRPWRRHLLADRFLTLDEFADAYLDVFPGGRVLPPGPGIPAALLWQAPAPSTGT